MLTDTQWAMLEPLIEACRPKGVDQHEVSTPISTGFPP